MFAVSWMNIFKNISDHLVTVIVLVDALTVTWIHYNKKTASKGISSLLQIRLL